MDCAKASRHSVFNLVLVRIYRCKGSVPLAQRESWLHVGCAENSDTDFLHYFSVVGIWTVHPPTRCLWDLDCTVGFNCDPSQGSLGIKEKDTPCYMAGLH